MSRDALVVGINKYPGTDRDNLPRSLSAPANDAEGIAQILEKYGDFDTVHRWPSVGPEPYHVGKKTSVTTKDLMEKISALLNPEGQQASETALLYFSGHGDQQRRYGLVENYLVTSDVSYENQNFGVSLDWLRKQLEMSPVRKQVVILDCCYAGALFNFDQLETDRGGTGRYFIAACRDTESAYEEKGSSLFTQAVIKGLDPARLSKGQIFDADLTPFINEQFPEKIQLPLSYNTGERIRLTLTTQGATDLAESNNKHLRMPTVPLEMPPLPDHFVERPEQQNAVKAELLNETTKKSTLVVSAIYGLGGIGKSVLASKLAHDKEVQDRFCDGILWATLGQNPDILPLLSGWIQSLGDYDYKPTAIESATNHLRTLLYDKRMLLVVDDVWNPKHLEPFRVGGEGSCVMVTTREARIPEARRYDLDVMDEAQAIELMTQKLSEPLSEQAREQALAFAKRVGYLPLALELAASQIEEGVSWQELFEDFTAEVARLEGLDWYGCDEEPDDAERRKYSLLACFNLSLKQLSAEQLRQFAWLGIVPEDVSLTQQMAETLWQVTGRQAGSILRTFRNKALVLQGAKQADERVSYRMHDLMHDLAQRLLVSPVEPEKVGELPGLGLSKAAAHGELLKRYRAKTVEGQWHMLKDDGYIFAHLTWHMEQAGQADAIHELLCASDIHGRNGWYVACDALGKPAGFVNDLGRAWQLTVKGYKREPGKEISQLLRYTLVRAALNSLASNVSAEMVGGLVKAGVWQPAQGLAYAQQAKDPWHRSDCISAILPYMPKSLLPEVSKTISQIKDAAYRSYVLSKLAQHFPEVWPEVLSTIRQIHDRYGSHRHKMRGFSYRSLALCRIVKHLPSQYLSEATETTIQIKDIADRATALTELAKRNAYLWSAALKATQEIPKKYVQSRMLSTLAEYMPDLWTQALNITREIEDEFYRSVLLSKLAKHMPELWPETLNIARVIEDGSSRSVALSTIIEHMSEVRWPEVLNIVREITDESAQSRGLIAVARNIPELCPEALTIARAIENSSYRSRALSAIAMNTPELWPEALKATREIEDKFSQYIELHAIVKHLPEALWPKALTIVREIEDKSYRSRALSAIAINIPGLWPEALKATREIEDDFSYSRSLIVLAKLMPNLWPEALDSVRKIKDESNRSYALIAAAEYMPELRLETLSTIREIEDKYQRSRMLCEMAQYMPELWPAVLNVVREIKDDFYCFYVLREMAQHIPETLCLEVLSIVREIKSKYQRSLALSEMTERLPELWSEALEVAQEAENEYVLSCTLSKIIKQVPETSWPEALSIMREIKGKPALFRTSSAVATHIMPELWLEALRVVRGIKDESAQAMSLSEVAENIPEALWPEVLDVMREVKDESSRSRTLRAIAPHLSKARHPEAIAILHSIQDKYYSAQALQGCLPHFDALTSTFPDFAKALDTLAYQNRSDLLKLLPTLRPIIMRLGEDEETFLDVLQSVREVCKQWP